MRDTTYTTNAPLGSEQAEALNDLYKNVNFNTPEMRGYTSRKLEHVDSNTVDIRICSTKIRIAKQDLSYLPFIKSVDDYLSKEIEPLITQLKKITEKKSFLESKKGNDPQSTNSSSIEFHKLDAMEEANKELNQAHDLILKAILNFLKKLFEAKEFEQQKSNFIEPMTTELKSKYFNQLNILIKSYKEKKHLEFDSQFLKIGSFTNDIMDDVFQRTKANEDSKIDAASFFIRHGCNVLVPFLNEIGKIISSNRIKKEPVQQVMNSPCGESKPFGLN